MGRGEYLWFSKKKTVKHKIPGESALFGCCNLISVSPSSSGLAPGVSPPLPDSFLGRPRFLLGAVNAEPKSGLAAIGGNARFGCVRWILCKCGGGGGAGAEDSKEDAIEGRSHLQW